MTDCGRFGNTQLPVPACPAGKEYWGGLCYSACPSGWTRTASCTCVEPGGGLWTDCGGFGAVGTPNVPVCASGAQFEGDRCWEALPACGAAPAGCDPNDPTVPCYGSYTSKPGEAVFTGFLYGRHCGLGHGGGQAINELDRCCNFHDANRWN